MYIYLQGTCFHRSKRPPFKSFAAATRLEFIISVEHSVGVTKAACTKQSYLECAKVSSAWHRQPGLAESSSRDGRSCCLDCTRAREESRKGDASAACVLVTCSATIPWREISNRFLTSSTNISSMRYYLKELLPLLYTHTHTHTHVDMYVWGHFSRS